MYGTIADRFLSKGYKDYYEEFDQRYENPSHTMIKNNTSITFVEVEGLASMIFRNEYLGQKYSREEAAEKRRKQEEGQKSTQNDF
mgnify:CR=1 FL=1